MVRIHGFIESRVCGVMGQRQTEQTLKAVQSSGAWVKRRYIMGMTEEDYLAFERASETKHEYVKGEIFALSGGTRAHGAVAANIMAEVRIALFGRGCQVLTSDVRLKIATEHRYVYPDASVLCGRVEYEDERNDTVLNPRIVVEVLSESSEAYDRGDKFAAYRTIPSLKHYVLASQEKPLIEVYTRKYDGTWLYSVYGPGDKAVLPALDCALDVDRVYTDVFPVAEG